MRPGDGRRRPGEQRRQRRRLPPPSCPPTSAASSSTTPTAEASSVRPGRQTFIQKPIRIAIGMVQAMVNTPHGLSRSALTTTSASTASRMIMIARMATIAAMPVTGPISSLRHLAQRLAVAAHRGEEDDEVLHRAAEHDAEDDPERAGQVAELGGQHRARPAGRRRRWRRSGGRRAPTGWWARSRGRWSAARRGWRGGRRGRRRASARKRL